MPEGPSPPLGKQKRREMREGVGVWPGVWLGSIGGEGRGGFRVSGPPGPAEGTYNGLAHRLAVERRAGQEKTMDGNDTTTSKVSQKASPRSLG